MRGWGVGGGGSVFGGGCVKGSQKGIHKAQSGEKKIGNSMQRRWRLGQSGDSVLLRGCGRESGGKVTENKFETRGGRQLIFFRGGTGICLVGKNRKPWSSKEKK